VRYPAYTEWQPIAARPLNRLPAHWRWRRLRFLTERIEQGWSPQCDNLPADDDAWGVMKVGCVNGHGFDATENKALPPALPPLPEYELQPGDVLVSRANTRELVGSAALVPRGVRPRLLLCDKLFRLRPMPGIEPAFLVYLLRTPAARFHYERDATGASGSMQNIGQDTLKDLVVPLPPEEEQRRIANFLDWKTGQIDALIAKKQALQRAIEQQRVAMITDCVTGAGKWLRRRVRTFLSFLTSGSRGWAEYFSDEGSLFLRITNLQRAGISLDLHDLQRVAPPDSAEGLRTRTRPGDLLVSITAELGSVAVVPDNFEPAYVSQHLALLRIESDQVNPSWVAYSFVSSFGRYQLETSGYGGTKVQLGLDEIKNFEVYLPPTRSEQDRLIDALTASLAKLDAARDKVIAATARLTEYRSALITAATTGQIAVRGVAVPAAA
jgi:type I restriction enzyme, S subunit